MAEFFNHHLLSLHVLVATCKFFDVFIISMDYFWSIYFIRCIERVVRYVGKVLRINWKEDLILRNHHKTVTTMVCGGVGQYLILLLILLWYSFFIFTHVHVFWQKLCFCRYWVHGRISFCHFILIHINYTVILGLYCNLWHNYGDM